MNYRSILSNTTNNKQQTTNKKKKNYPFLKTIFLCTFKIITIWVKQTPTTTTTPAFCAETCRLMPVAEKKSYDSKIDR